MRIALVKRRYSLRHGGSERYCVNLARQLQRAGHDVTVIGERIDDDLLDQVRFIAVPVNRLTSWTSNRSFAENCGRAAREGRFDVVYGLGRSFGLDAVRVTERVQSHWVNVYYRGRLNRFLQRLNPRHRTLMELERTIYRSDRVRRVVTQSRLDRRLLVEYYGVPEAKIRTIYNGVDTDAYHPGLAAHREQTRAELQLQRRDPVLLFASMDFEGKGLRTVLSAMSAARCRDLRLLVLGSGPIRRFQRLAGDFGLANRVQFAGRRGDIGRHYAAADLFVLPTAYEPFPNVNLEAMACGTPVITTVTAGGADLLDDGRNGYLISGMPAAGELAERVDRFFSLPTEARKKMRENCWQTARQFTVERNVRQTLEMLEEVRRAKV